MSLTLAPEKVQKDHQEFYEQEVRKPAPVMVQGCIFVLGKKGFYISVKANINAEMDIETLEQHPLVQIRSFSGTSMYFKITFNMHYKGKADELEGTAMATFQSLSLIWRMCLEF